MRVLLRSIYEDEKCYRSPNATFQNKFHLIIKYSFNALLNSANILLRMFAISEIGL